MKENISTKLSDYLYYTFLIPKINIDFNIGEDKVFVQTSMFIKSKSEESSKLILKGYEIELISQVWFKPYNPSNDQGLSDNAFSEYDIASFPFPSCLTIDARLLYPST